MKHTIDQALQEWRLTDRREARDESEADRGLVPFFLGTALGVVICALVMSL